VVSSQKIYLKQILLVNQDQVVVKNREKRGERGEEKEERRKRRGERGEEKEERRKE